MIDIRLTKVKGVADLVRQACQFNNSIGLMYAKKTEEGHRLMIVGEKVGKSRMAYYYDYNKAPNYILYSANGRESFSFVDNIGPDTGYQMYKIQVLHMKNDAFRVPKAARYNVSVVELVNYGEIVKGIANAAANSDTIGTIYMFPYEGSKHIGAFGFLPDDDFLTFTHAEMPDADGDYCFFKYDYNTGSISRANGMQSSPSLYTRIVNMEEPFDFLNHKQKRSSGTNK